MTNQETEEKKDEQNVCPSCKGYGICLTCDGTGTWYAGSFNEEKCGSCRGIGNCPACLGISQKNARNEKTQS